MAKYSELPLSAMIKMCLKYFIVYFSVIYSVNLWVNYHGAVLYDAIDDSDFETGQRYLGIKRAYNDFPIPSYLIVSKESYNYLMFYNEIANKEDKLALFDYLSDAGTAMVAGFRNRDFYFIEENIFLNPLLYNLILFLILINRAIRKIQTFPYYKKIKSVNV